MAKELKTPKDAKKKKKGKITEKSRLNLDVDEKCQIIEYLKSHRHALFDQFSTKLTPSNQHDAWKEAVLFAKRYSLEPHHLSYFNTVTNTT